MLEFVELPEELLEDRVEMRGEHAGGGHHESRRGGGGGGNGHSSGGGGGSNGGGGNHSNGGGGGRAEVPGGRRNSNAVHFERRAGRTASKKRREYSRERQLIHVYGSVHEPESDSRADLQSGDSFDDGGRRRHSHGAGGQHCSAPHAPTSKRSVFARFFSHGHGHSRSVCEKYMVRDYSIDEKTNQIFNEFLRQEATVESGISVGGGGGNGGGGNGGGGGGGARLGLRRSPRPQHRPRLQRKHTEPLYRLDDRRRDRLAPEMRSASLGSDSSASSVRRLSPPGQYRGGVRGGGRGGAGLEADGAGAHAGAGRRGGGGDGGREGGRHLRLHQGHPRHPHHQAAGGGGAGRFVTCEPPVPSAR